MRNDRDDTWSRWRVVKHHAGLQIVVPRAFEFKTPSLSLCAFRGSAWIETNVANPYKNLSAGFA